MFTTKRKATLVAIVVTTTVVFAGLLYREYQGMESYMSYIAENGKSALFHEEYINQSVAFRLSTEFSATLPATPNVDDPQTVCQHSEHVDNVYGLNLKAQTFPVLKGTLQTRNAKCDQWAADVPELAALLEDKAAPSSRYSFSNYTGYNFDNSRYYIDLENNYIYSNKLINVEHDSLQNWLLKNNNNIDITIDSISINLGKKALDDLRQGNNIISHIYKDNLTQKNIISMLNPVFSDGKIKGVIITDFDIDDLATSFYTPERPLLWSFLTMFVEDNQSQQIIQFHTSKYSLFPVINYQAPITRFYTLNVRLDVLYLILNTLWLFIIYIITTLLLWHYARRVLNRHASLAQDNVTDPMTGLFNRKVLSPTLEKKIHDLLIRQIAVTVIAVDCDGLKRINDTLGHHMGDRAIKLLGEAIAKSVRKSDYGIRLGGDEFNIILIDADLAKAQESIRRIETKLLETDKEQLVRFSWGTYQMSQEDSLETAFIKADAMLYTHKQGKQLPRTR